MKSQRVARFAFWIVMGGILSAGVVVVNTRASRPVSAAQVQTLVQGPNEWVPLTMEYTVSLDASHVKNFVEYRRTDGSTRVEELGEDQGIQISNFSTRNYYRFRNGEWFQHPLRFQKAGGKPIMALDRRTVTQVAPQDERLQAVSNLGVPVTCYEFSAGARAVFCAELNMLEVSYRSPGGDVRQITQLVLGEPNVEFQPPQGVSVTVRPDPAGPGIREAAPSVLRQSFTNP